MEVTVNHAKEFRLASSVLALFWAIAAVLVLLTWRVPAFILLVMGTAAACERLLRVAKGGSPRSLRFIAGCALAAVLPLAFGLAFFVHPAFHHSVGP